MATGTCTVLPGTLTTSEFSNSQSNALTRDQTRHLFCKTTSFGQLVGDTPTTKEILLHIAQSAGTVRQFQACLEETGSSTSITFDLKKYAAGASSGSTVLSAVVTVTNSDTDGTVESGTINAPTYSAGDRFYALMTVSSSTGAAGPECQAVFDEVAGS